MITKHVIWIMLHVLSDITHLLWWVFNVRIVRFNLYCVKIYFIVRL